MLKRCSMCLSIFLSLIFGLTTASAFDQFELSDAEWKQENGKYYLEGKAIEVVLASDGCIESFRFFKPGEARVHIPSLIKYGFGLPIEHGNGGSRGGFFYQNNPLALDSIAIVSNTELVAQNKKAYVSYGIDRSNFIINLTNKTDQPLQYFWLLNPSVVAVCPEGGNPEATPKIARWQNTNWFWNDRIMSIRGTTEIWGPGALIALTQNSRIGQFQVVETLLAPKESKSLMISGGISTPEQQQEVSSVTTAVPGRGTGPSIWLAPKPALQSNAITIFSPSDYQVFQRSNRKNGTIFLSGHLTAECETLAYHITGNSIDGSYDSGWKDIALLTLNDGFTQSIDLPAGGWYTLELKGILAEKTIFCESIKHFGIGEVFVGCGQSNSTNYGQAPTKTETEMVAAFSGEHWQLANDPQPGTCDNSRWGSFWPSFGDALYQLEHVPVGVAVTGRGGAPVSNWRPGSLGFCWTMNRINQLGIQGFRALLWHQGESNARGSGEEYFDQLTTIINASRNVAGWYFPWFVARTSYHNPKETHFDHIRDAQQKVCDMGFAFSGPDTDQLQGDYRDGIHLSVKGLQKHGKMWAEIISEYIDRVEK